MKKHLLLLFLCLLSAWAAWEWKHPADVQGPEQSVVAESGGSLHDQKRDLGVEEISRSNQYEGGVSSSFFVLQPDCLPVTAFQYRVLDENRVPLSGGSTRGGKIPIPEGAVGSEVSVQGDGWHETRKTLGPDPSDASLVVHAITKASGKVFSATSGVPVRNFTLVVSLGQSGSSVPAESDLLNSRFAISGQDSFQIGGFFINKDWFDSFLLHVRAEGYLPYASEWFPITEGMDWEGIQIPLVSDQASKVLVEGRVVDFAGQPLAGVDCLLVPEKSMMRNLFLYQDGSLILEAVVDLAGPPIPQTTTDRHGGFRLEAEKAGNYHLLIVAKELPAWKKDMGFLDPGAPPRYEEVRFEAAGNLIVSLTYPQDMDPDFYQVLVRNESEFFATPKDVRPGLRQFRFAGLSVGSVQVSLLRKSDPVSPVGAVLLDERITEIHASFEVSVTFEQDPGTQDDGFLAQLPVVEGIPASNWVALVMPQTHGEPIQRAMPNADGLASFSRIPDGAWIVAGYGLVEGDTSTIALAAATYDTHAQRLVDPLGLEVNGNRVVLEFASDLGEFPSDSLKIFGDPADPIWTPLIHGMGQDGPPLDFPIQVLGLPDGTYYATYGSIRSEAWTFGKEYPQEVVIDLGQ